MQKETKELEWRKKTKHEVKRFIERVEFLIKNTDPSNILHLPHFSANQKALVEMYLAAYRWQLLDALSLEYLLLSLNLRLEEENDEYSLEEVSEPCQ